VPDHSGGSLRRLLCICLVSHVFVDRKSSWL
jgi:hypothetical protein